ncbi:cationic amino acid transporter 4-like [Antedon mediterranea]|uniref:cationic amino acid transporter 4-like n=1 Tax=Antedon mediterranea TaxID=105859 RepID=UPI003AF90A6B
MEKFKNIFANIIRRKIIRSDILKTKLNRCLTTFDLTFIALSYVLGVGVFILCGSVAATLAGPAVDVSILIAAASALLSALCYAEFCCRIPQAGSAYLYTYLTIGEIWAFIIGWNMILEYVACAGSLSRALSSTIDNMFGDVLHNLTVNYILNGKEWNTPFLANYPDLLAAFMILCFTIILLFGVKISSRINAIVVIFVMTFIAILEGYGVPHINFSNWSNYGGFFPYGFGGVVSGSAKLFFLYAGFEVICISSEECIDPVKSVPKALLSAVLVNTCINLVLVSTLTLIVPWCEINPIVPLSDAFQQLGEVVPTYVIVVALTFSVSGSTLVTLHALPRFVYSMAKDGLMFTQLSQVSSRNRVPVTATLIFGGITILVVLFVDFYALVESLNIGSLICYTVVSGSVINLRYRPEEENVKMFNKQCSLSTDLCRSRVGELSGTLKPKFQCLNFLASEVPGRTVAIATIAYALCCACVVVMLNHNDVMKGSWIYIILFFLFILGCIFSFAVILMHYQNNEELTFRTPYVPFVPAFSMLFNIVLLVNLSIFTWIRFAIWVLIGLIIYAKYGYHHSKAAVDLEEEEETLCDTSNDDPPTNDYGTVQLLKIQSTGDDKNE